MRIPVFLSYNTLHDRLGMEVKFPERRLTRKSPSDRVIAIIEAPRGTRVRRKRDDHGDEQLVVPMGRTLWDRLFGEKAVIPAKYVIGSARNGSYGLVLAEFEPAESSR
jgi:hypothetical protein